MKHLEPTTIYAALTRQIEAQPQASEISLGDPSAGVGQAAQAKLLTVTSGATATTMSVSADSSVFEGQPCACSSASWDGATILSGDSGVPIPGSALIEGYRVYVQHEDGLLRAAIYTELTDNGSGYGTGGTVTALEYEDAADSTPIYALAQFAGLELNSKAVSYVHPPQAETATLTLGGIFPSLKTQDIVVVEYRGALMPAEITEYTIVTRGINEAEEAAEDGVKVSVSQIVIRAAEFIPQPESPGGVRIWFDARKAGTLERIPTEAVQPSELLLGPTIEVTLTSAASLPVDQVDVIIEDAEGAALVAKADIYTDQNDATFVNITEIPEQGFEGELVKPLSFHWGLSTVTRGASINREVLGSGDANLHFQTFTLAKSPLTYVADANARGGRRAELAVYVDGVQWRRAPSFYGAQPSDQIYIVKHDANHDAHIIFGDGELGSRLPTGASNVVARYRHGTGGNVDASAINRLARPAQGVRSVVNPLPASGGEDPPTASQARTQAIQGRRTLGKLVSLPDFEVEAARWGGVEQAKAKWDWDQSSDTALVKLWVIAPGAGDPSVDIQAYLQNLAEPATRVRVIKASAIDFLLYYELIVDPSYIREDVYAAVNAQLFDEEVGFFAPRNTLLGGVFLRSRLYAKVHAIPGVDSVRIVTTEGELPVKHRIEEGRYLAPSLSSFDPSTVQL